MIKLQLKLIQLAEWIFSATIPPPILLMPPYGIYSANMLNKKGRMSDRTDFGLIIPIPNQ